MKVIIPMAGTGNRFVNKGYDVPKPLIKVNNKRIIEYILDPFDADDEIVFICNDQHIENTNMSEVLKELRPNSTIVSMPNHKLGPVYTVKRFYDFIDDEEEVMVSYCDNAFVWEKQSFVDHVNNNNLDGCILTHTGLHPHTLNSTKMAFLKTEDDLLTEIKEKECYTDDPLSEHASTGAYYFRKGKFVKKYFDLSIEKNINHNGEYYVTLVYNLLVQDNLRVGYYDTDFVTVFGTPEEVESFEAWKTILTSGQVKNADDLINCYNYWSKYHERNIC
jgi:hypothetical protein